MLLFYALCSVFLFTAVVGNIHPLSEEFIEIINSIQTTWKAGRNFHESISMDYIKSLMGVIKMDRESTLPLKRHDDAADFKDVENFDPRDKWPNCKSLNEVRDQGSCGSCWAFGAVAAMTDRVCIFSNGKKNFHFSAEDLNSCCRNCGAGCHGGSPEDAWTYWVKTGIVSGGPYNSNEGCSPYTIEQCDHHVNGTKKPCGVIQKTPACKNTCRKGYNVDYQADKHHGKRSYSIEGEDHLKAELYKHGPVEVTFEVFEDFLSYKTGVYQHVHGKSIGYHAVKMLGWGVENGTKYWLIANSWNSDWGDHGFIKFLRGEDHCGIERKGFAGEPA